jgi:hypothetical protein
MEDPLALAERIVNLRGQLREAEEEFQKLVGGPRRGGKRSQAVRKAKPGGVASQVRQILQASGRPMAFSEILDGIPGAKNEAVKSALKKARGGGTVGFRGFKYYWK